MMTKVGDADYIAIFWTEGDHAEYLEELSDYYTMETEVFVFVDTVPRSDYRAITFNELAAHSEAFDIIVGESVWLGEGVLRGHYVELTEWVKELGVDRSMVSEVLRASGEYPFGSGRYWAVPVSGEGLGWSYRRDKFEDAGEKQAGGGVLRGGDIHAQGAGSADRGDRECAVGVWDGGRGFWHAQGRGDTQQHRRDRGVRVLQGAVRVLSAWVGECVQDGGQPGDDGGYGCDVDELL
jgi:ABC-type glycerol-3-phosphate transport system substrate-binding protein